MWLGLWFFFQDNFTPPFPSILLFVTTVKSVYFGRLRFGIYSHIWCFHLLNDVLNESPLIDNSLAMLLTLLISMGDDHDVFLTQMYTCKLLYFFLYVRSSKNPKGDWMRVNSNRLRHLNTSQHLNKRRVNSLIQRVNIADIMQFRLIVRI